MKLTVSRKGAAALAAALFAFLGAPAARAQAPDSLTLQSPDDVKAWSVFDPQTKQFKILITWLDGPDSLGTYISPPDTTGWSIETPVDSVTYPTMGGAYTGDIDRTASFQALDAGDVGTDAIRITYFIRGEEYYSGQINLAPGYVPGTPIPLPFRDQRDNSTVDFGINVSFSAGRMDELGTFIAGLEDFEGFHVWRGVKENGSDLEVIGELSKEEAFRSGTTGGSFVDSLYFYDVVPELRKTNTWFVPAEIGSIECLGTRIDLDLDPDGYFWYDCDGSNGFTYYFAVTTYDRGYTMQSGAQGLSKRDHCPVSEGTAYPCNSELVRLSLEVTTQSDLYNVYVVPNPVRIGSSRLTTDNYHNFPDGLVRFVNVPADCTIKIYTIAGNLVWVNEHVDGTGNVEWDIRNLEEQEVASGVYVYRIESDVDSVYGRIVVIR